MEPADAKDMIDEAIERAEEERGAEERADRAAERRFRDRVSVLVGVLAVALAIVHVAAAGAARDSLLRGIAASDTFAYMQAKIVRETVLSTAATAQPDSPAAAGWRAEATRLRAPDRAGHGIVQLERAGAALRDEGERAARRGERYEMGETALQLGIVLLSIALVARSGRIVAGAVVLAAAGVLLAAVTALGAPPA